MLKIAKNCIIKCRFKFEYHENYLKANKIENEIKNLKDDKCDVDEMEEKYDKCLSENKY